MNSNIFGNLLGHSPYQQQSLNVSKNFSQALQNSVATGLGMTQQQLYNQVYETPDWVYDGQPMTLQEFATTVYGDTPERTMFILKFMESNKK